MADKPEKIIYDTAGVLSRLCFWWLQPLLTKGWKLELNEEDLLRNSKEDDSEYLGDLLQKEWNSELKKKNPSLLKCLIRLFAWKYLQIFPLALIQECFIFIIQAYFIGGVIDYFEYKLEKDKISAYISAVGVCATTILYIFVQQIFMFNGYRLDMKLSVACSKIVYRKALKLNHSSLGKSSIGQMVNLLSNDINRFDMCTVKVFYLITGPLQVIITMVMLWHYLGYAILAGVSIMLFYVLLQIALGRAFSSLRLKTAKLTDKRLHLINEIMKGMRVIKMFTWENLFVSSVEVARKEEVKNIKKSLLIYGIPHAMGLILSKFILFLSFFTFSVTGGKLTASTAFVAVSLSVNLYRSIFYSFPQAISKITEALISVKRLQKFLLLEEKCNAFCMENSKNSEKECGISVENIIASWNKDMKPTLHNLTLNAQPGDLLIIVGSVGSGKTSLLMAILGEIPVLSGKVNIKGKLAYASQEAWIFSGSIRENIIFGDDYCEKKYNEVLLASALEKDISMFPDGDLTFVGERGTILSGGQKARINMARALYSDADIVVLDDPLSAVDAPVAKHIFEKCIMGYLKDKITILTTHQIQFLKYSSKIIVLKEGKIQANGSYNELMMKGINLGILSEESKQSMENGSSDLIISFSNKNMPKYSRNGLVYDMQSNLEKQMAERKISEVQITKNKYEKIAKEKELKICKRIAVYKEYINAGIGMFSQIVLLILFILSQLLVNGTDYWLVKWTNQYGYNAEQEMLEYYTMKIDSSNNTKCPERILPDITDNFNIIFYSGLVFGLIISSLFTSMSYFTMCMKSSLRLHDNMIRCIVNTPITFMDKNPIGKILNRFSRDMGIVDQLLPTISLLTLNTFTNIFGMFLLKATLSSYLFIPSVMVSIGLFFLWYFYVRTARDIKRLEATTRSPVFTHLTASLYGLSTIRAFKVERKFEATFDKYQDKHTSCRFLYICLCHWIYLRIQFICVINLVITVVTLFYTSSYVTGGEVGLSISYALKIFLSFSTGLLLATEVESQLTSVDRVLDYCKLPSETACTSSNNHPPDDWPQKGFIEFKDVSLKYPGHEKEILKNLNFHIRSGEKVGIVGRTGAGKSSMIAALFRMTEPTGTIFIDGIATRDIDVHELRRKISIIPQDPLLFTGSLRHNIDPYKKHDEESLWKVLEEVHLKEVVEVLNGGLHAEISEAGSNFSVGQRQLICLARAILHRNKILILDEATANIDKETDSLIQQTIRKKFSSSTIITIAHRLQTIMDSDRVLVLQDGKIQEFDEPYKLLKIKKSVFYNMARITEDTTKHLYLNAKDNFLSKDMKNKIKKSNEKCKNV